MGWEMGLTSLDFHVLQYHYSQAKDYTFNRDSYESITDEIPVEYIGDQ